ncbi:Hypothetical_protein [Hexamita inflata]|uniref:Hypothetical_protein n=1 Tax=Hexamita inflata TaxID=28002 RepID=A0AA86TVD9_9EUKA|nr:Hypothetical protein HINF_LOCUS17744 [Hexamita inflata]
MPCYFNDTYYNSYSECYSACSGWCVQSYWDYCCKPKGSLWWLAPLFGGLATVVASLIVGYRQYRKKQKMVQERSNAAAQQMQIDTALQMQASIMMHNTKQEYNNQLEQPDNQTNKQTIAFNNQTYQNSLNFTAVM